MKFLTNKYRFKVEYIIYYYLLFYFIINIIFLVDFPFVHSDEPWLSGLSRAMLVNKDLSVTEPFFDVYERNPHAIKTIFHIIQIIFIKTFGYSIFSFRLISLIFSVGSLYIFNLLCKTIFKSDKVALISTILLSFDIQYIYASHFARQEIIIMFFMLASTYTLYSTINNHNYYRDLLIGIIIGISIGIHPNSFLIALTIGGIYLYMFYKKKLGLKNLLLLILIVSIFALIFIGVSLHMDGDFLENYRESGKQFGVDKSPSEKLLKFRDFYQNIYDSKSVTYYIPNIKFQLFLFPIFFIFSLLIYIKERRHQEDIEIKGISITIIFINLGIIIIGRYNVTSVIFIFPFMYILAVYTLFYLEKRKQIYLILSLLLITLFNTTINNEKTYFNSYPEYISELSKHINKDAKVLSNLNTEYYFQSGNLLDYRNLHHIQDKDIGFEQYITSKKIEYIIYYDEIDYIHEKNPIYNGVYGDVSIFYDEMQSFLKSDCYRVHSFKNSTYGTNIVRLIDDRDWYIHIYKVKN
jgi:4-amino-4-deoxy-L-arabinose transferase-like glycosyltransferase